MSRESESLKESTLASWVSVQSRAQDGRLSAAELRAWQEEALRVVVRHAYEGSSFYRRRLRGLDLASLSLSDLRRLPFTTKADLGEAMYELICGDIRDSLYFFCTTGTTGRSTPCPRSALDFDLDNAPIAASLGRILRAWLPPGEKPVIAMLCPNETHSVCSSISAAAKTLGVFKFDAFPLSPVIGFERLFELLLELRANVVICSPGLLMALAEMSMAYGIDVKEDLFVECALTTGELCTPSMARLIQDTWGARTCNWWYGSQEAGTSALAEPDGALVAVSTNHVLEVVDVETGQSQLGEGKGELVLTTLIPGMKPLLRYRTGDLVRMKTDPSGRGIVEILGRVKDAVTLGGKSRSAAEIEQAVLEEHGLIYGYQLEILHADGHERLIVRVKPKEAAEHARVRHVIAASVRRSLGVDCMVETVPLLDMITATGGWVSWKTARIKDRRYDEPSDLEAVSATALARTAERRI